MARTIVERDELLDRTIVRHRNAVGGWSTLLDQDGNPVDFLREALELNRPKFRDTHAAWLFFQNIDAHFDQWWNDDL